jgi:uncharacterized protein YndB with AHSA1/START domain
MRNVKLRDEKMNANPNPATGDQAKVTITVAVNPAEAFNIFTEDINLWWRRGPRFRNSAGDHGIICIEPGVDGRVFESCKAEANDERAIEIGRIKIWDPPHRLLFDWRNSNFAPNEHTEVEVLFAPSASGTRVTVVHRGWRAIRPDHPARHGLQSAEFIRMMGLWWGDQMRSLDECAGRKEQDE